MGNEKRIARVKIDFGIIEKFILPEGTKIIRVNPQDPRIFNDKTLELVIESEEFESVPLGAYLPIVGVGFMGSGKGTGFYKFFKE